MTEALKTDRLEQAKREIAQEQEIEFYPEGHAYWAKNGLRNITANLTREENKLFDALVAERARNLELRDAFLDVLHSPDCSHVHIQDCTHQNCEFYRARNVLLKKVSHERD
jgi:hypothetical protein